MLVNETIAKAATTEEGTLLVFFVAEACDAAGVGNFDGADSGEDA